MRRHRVLFAILGAEALLLAGLAGTVAWGRIDRTQTLAANRMLVKALGLTDPALFTEARYTRHLSQADFFSPFQDQPGALEHFPSGSVVAPPARQSATNR
jgi:hypothetical protein